MDGGGSGDTARVIERVCVALEKSQSADLANDERQRILSWLESLKSKSNLAAVFQVGRELATSPRFSGNERVRLFGYHLLDFLCSEDQFSGLGSSVQNEVYQFLMRDLVSREYRIGKPSQFRTIRGQISKVLISLCVHRYPRNHPSFMNPLFETAKSSIHGCDVLLFFLRELIDECDGDNFRLPSKCKRLIKTSLISDESMTRSGGLSKKTKSLSSEMSSSITDGTTALPLSHQIASLIQGTLIRCAKFVCDPSKITEDVDPVGGTSSDRRNRRMQRVRGLHCQTEAGILLQTTLQCMPKYMNLLSLNLVSTMECLTTLCRILYCESLSFYNFSLDNSQSFFLLTITVLDYYFIRKFSELPPFETLSVSSFEKLLINVWTRLVQIAVKLNCIATAKGEYAELSSQLSDAEKNALWMYLQRLTELLLRIFKKFHFFLSMQRQAKMRESLVSGTTVAGSTSTLTPQGRVISSDSEATIKSGVILREKWLELCEMLMTSENLDIRESGLEIWRFIVSDSAVMKGLLNQERGSDGSPSQQSTVLSQLLHFVLLYYIRNRSVHRLNEFDSEEDWLYKHSKLFSLIRQLLVQILTLIPLRSVQMILKLTHHVLYECQIQMPDKSKPLPWVHHDHHHHPSSSPSSDSSSLDIYDDNDGYLAPLNCLGQCTIENDQYIRMDGLVSVFKTAFFFDESANSAGAKKAELLHCGIKPKDRLVQGFTDIMFDEIPSMLDTFEELFKMVVKYRTDDPLLKSRWYQLLTVFTALYKRKDPSKLLLPVYLNLLKELDQIPLILPAWTTDSSKSSSSSESGSMDSLSESVQSHSNASDFASDVRCNAMGSKKQLCYALINISRKLPQQSALCLRELGDGQMKRMVMSMIERCQSTIERNTLELSSDGLLPPQPSPPVIHEWDIVINGEKLGTTRVTKRSVFEVNPSGFLPNLFEFLSCVFNGVDDPKIRIGLMKDTLIAKGVLSKMHSDRGIETKYEKLVCNPQMFAQYLQWPLQRTVPAIVSSEKGKKYWLRKNRMRYLHFVRCLFETMTSIAVSGLFDSSKGQSNIRDVIVECQLYDIASAEEGHLNTSSLSSDSSSISGSSSVSDRAQYAWSLYSVLIPDVLRMAKLLNYVYTDEFMKMFINNDDDDSHQQRNSITNKEESKAYQSAILALNVRSLYALHGYDYDTDFKRKAVDKRPELVVCLEGIVLFLTHITDSIWKFLGLSSIFGHVFFESIMSDEKRRLLFESVMIGAVNHLPLSRLALFNKQFVSVTIQLCPSKNVPDLMRLIGPVLESCVLRLTEEWKKGHLEEKEDPKHEVHRDAALRNASNKLWLALVSMCVTYKDRGYQLLLHAATNNLKRRRQEAMMRQQKLQSAESWIASEENVSDNMDGRRGLSSTAEGSSSEQTKSTMLRQDLICQLILSNERLCSVVFSAIVNTLDIWDDNGCRLRAAQIACKLIRVAKEKIDLLNLDMIGGYCLGIFRSLINVLSKENKSDSQSIAELITLSQHILQYFGQELSDSLMSMLIRIPKVSEKDLSHMRQVLMNAPRHKHDANQFKLTAKSFFMKYVIGKHDLLVNEGVSRVTQVY